MTYQFTPEQEAWLRDLETTEEPQTKGFLHRVRGMDVGYCCLGRACVVLDILEEVEEGIGHFDGRSGYLPEFAVEKLRFRGLAQNQLVAKNDDGWTFKEIAAHIRANPLNVFLPPEEDK